MRRPLIVATTAGAVLVAGLLAVPAMAATDTTRSPSTAACPMDGMGSQAGAGRGMGAQAGAGRGMGAQAGAGRGMGRQAGQGMGMGNGSGMGSGRGPGMGAGHQGGTVTDPLVGLTKGTLTDSRKQALAAMAEEEKLAHDVYAALAAKTGDARFTRISTAETRHLTELRALLTRYTVTDPTAGKADGTFTTAAVQQQYTALVARGSASADAALAVGRDIEKADIADLATARADVTAADVQTVYDRLTRGSQMHLRAFGG